MRRFIPACAGNSSRSDLRFAEQPVHPRVCGELTRTQRRSTGASGSSPRVRGTRPAGAGRSHRRRFIPACAGNSRRGPVDTEAYRVHPRVCGELALVDAPADAYSGSSPRVRGTRRRTTTTTRYRQVHPRVCGELSPQPAQLPNETGSSPRVRGTRTPGNSGRRGWSVHPRVCGELGRLIASLPKRATVHPRVCGELGLRRYRGGAAAGSSPRVRGTPSIRSHLGGPLRFIPACAGNSRPHLRPRRRTTVHPRVCGELADGPQRKMMGDGSSPRVRGTPAAAVQFLTRTRFIPACAGNSTGRKRTRAKPTVHPRVCGELRSTARSSRASSGSSPRVRGTRRRHRRRHRNRRFIPACAGNSPPPARSTRARTVHPRVCGELGSPRKITFAPHGSSPRVRGTPCAPGMLLNVWRFIPACAGNSTPPRRKRRWPAVHPRVCGELRAKPVELRAHAGSSPRVRGTRSGAPLARGVERFIPACAGNSYLAARR